jgi:hypothetical protein
MIRVGADLGLVARILTSYAPVARHGIRGGVSGTGCSAFARYQSCLEDMPPSLGDAHGRIGQGWPRIVRAQDVAPVRRAHDRTIAPAPKFTGV